MYSMIHNLRTGITLRESGALLIAFLIAEVFYKFHSFTLECAAFLVTWYALGAVASGVDALIGRRKPPPA